VTEHGASHPTPWDLLWPALNFILFAALLVHFLRGPIQEFFRARLARLRAALEAGARARKEAEATRAALQRDVADLPALRQRLRADVQVTAEHEARTMLELARRAAGRIRADAQLLVGQEFAAARQALRAEVIEEAVRQATALVRTGMRPEDQERFVQEFVSSAAGTGS
jgi:F-type H+-transporting ATPase subunit b